MQRERHWSRPGVWLYEDCPPAIRAVRLHVGVTASAIFACEAPPHVVRKRLGCATRATLVAAGRVAVRGLPSSRSCGACAYGFHNLRT